MFSGNSPFTVIPILLAVPATMRIAEASVKQFKSGILSSAISLTWSQVTLATFYGWARQSHP